MPTRIKEVTGMADDPITRSELSAHLDAVEARTETRFVELSGKIDRVVDSIASMRGEVSARLGQVERELTTVKSDNKFTRLTIVVAVVGSVIAGIAALWVTQANLLSAFQTGISLSMSLGSCAMEGDAYAER